MKENDSTTKLSETSQSFFTTKTDNDNPEPLASKLQEEFVDDGEGLAKTLGRTWTVNHTTTPHGNGDQNDDYDHD